MLDKKGPFSLAKGDREGLPYFLGVRQQFHKVENREKYPWLLTVKIDTEGEPELGLVSDEEGAVLNQLEDTLKEKLHTLADMFFVGRITWNRTRSLFYYVSDPKPVADRLNELIEEGEYSREFEYKIEKDPDWKKMSEIIPDIQKL